METHHRLLEEHRSARSLVGETRRFRLCPEIGRSYRLTASFQRRVICVRRAQITSVCKTKPYLSSLSPGSLLLRQRQIKNVRDIFTIFKTRHLPMFLHSRVISPQFLRYRNRRTTLVSAHSRSIYSAIHGRIIPPPISPSHLQSLDEFRGRRRR